VDAARGIPLAKEQPRDEEATDDEEDVDPEVPAGHGAGQQVERHHEQHRQRAEPVEPAIAGCREQGCARVSGGADWRRILHSWGRRLGRDRKQA
jgi:hypothetical protein